MARMLARLGWRGQCSCCNGPKPKKAIRAEEKARWARYVVETVDSVVPPRPAPDGGIPPDFDD